VSGVLDDASNWLPPRSEWENKTIITEEVDGVIKYRNDRPVVIVSSTSYTADENFGLLLDALLMYDRNHVQSNPRLLVIITGKGPLKEFYSKEITLLNLKQVKVVQVWLSADDYPKILGSSDLGVSLHTSSSGLDLPMKVVDMFGTCLPVCAVGFPW
jgi:beta-1,4-mannosyltransferase